MSTLLQDLRYSLRSLMRNPGFTAVALLTLAVGIGATSAIWSVVYHVMLRPLPFPEAERLVLVTTKIESLGFDKFWVSGPEWVDYERDSTSWAALGAYTTGAVNLTSGDRPLRVDAAQVSHELFEALARPALLGRTFEAAEDAPGGEPVVVLSYDLWQRAFAGNPDILSQNVQIDGNPVTIIGVMPENFQIRNERFDVYQPLALDRSNPGPRHAHGYYLIGRLADGVSLEQMHAELDTLLARWAENGEQHQLDASNHPFRFDTLHEDVVGDVGSKLWLLLGAVLGVLLIACANVANLQLVRAQSRRKEIAMRSAIGAVRARLIRQFLTEGAVLGLLGGVLGLVLAGIGLRTLLAIHPDGLPRSGEVGLDATVLGVTLLLGLGTGLLFGLAPALHLRRNLSGALKEGGGRGGSSSRHVLQRSLVVVEIALAVVLVISSGLLLRSFWNLMDVDAGFDPAPLSSFQLPLPDHLYPGPAEAIDFFSRLQTRLETLPGVEGVAVLFGLPPQRDAEGNTTQFEGLDLSGEDTPPGSIDYWQYASPGALETLGIPLVEGRYLEPGDDAEAPQVVVVNESLARTFYGDESPLGRNLRINLGDAFPWRTIVGVVKDMKQAGLDQAPGTEVFIPYPQAAQSVPPVFVPKEMHVLLRSSLPASSLATQVRTTLRDLDPALPVQRLRPLTETFRGTLAEPRFLTFLFGLFAVLALILAAVGTYGVLSIQVAERRRELGIRMALGALNGDILKLVLGQGMKLAGMGLVLGIAAAAFLHKLMASMVFGVETLDLVTFVAVPLLLAGVALAACYLPARRATSVSPVEVLRQE